MADTPKLSMPEISASQASKYLTHNQALRDMDALVQATVIDKDLTAPPGSPSDGDTYIVAATATGAWAGQEDTIAYYESSAWSFHTPSEGWRVWVQDENEPYVFVSTSVGWGKETETLAADFADLNDTPGNYTGDGEKLVRVNTAENALEFIVNSFDIGADLVGTPSGSLVLLRRPFTRSVDFPDDLAGSKGVAGVAATAQTDFAIKQDGSQFATMSFAASATTATFTTSDSVVESFVAGDVLTVVAPASPDATLADIGFMLAGIKT